MKEALRQALDMLNEIADDVYCDQKLEGVITALRQALAQPEQEPVAWQPIESALKTGRKVILFYKNRLNVGRTVIARGYATGHGDTIEDLLQELDWQIREQEREACAKLCDVLAVHPEYASDITKVAAQAIRAKT